ncbi:hypothetical protein LXJ59_25345, partial [Escherichia coli]|nr:hypothetical protein [Escherichia coli]
MAGGLAMIALAAAGMAAGAGAQTEAMASAKGDGASSPRARAERIVAQMTDAEKLALVHGLFPPFAAGKTPNELIPSAGHIDGVPRLGVPLVRESDASLGVANQVEQRKGDVATALPSSL